MQKAVIQTALLLCSGMMQSRSALAILLLLTLLLLILLPEAVQCSGLRQHRPPATAVMVATERACQAYLRLVQGVKCIHCI